MKLSVSKENCLVEELDLGNLVGQDSASFLVGRSTTCTLVLDDKMVSREHAAIDYRNGSWFIRQLSEFGNVNVNGGSIVEKELSTGDIISIGPFVTTCFVLPIDSPITQPENDLTEILDTVEEDDSTNTMMVENETVESEVESNDLEVELEEEDIVEENEEAIVEENEVAIENEDDNFILDSEDTEFSEDNDGLEGFEESTVSDQELSEDGFVEDNEPSDEYGLEEYEDDEDKTQVFQAFSSIRLDLFGENAPYDSFKIETKEVYVGRNTDKCQIVLSDTEVSGVHAVIKKNNVTCTIEDLQSGNGTLLNGERINKANLTNGDEFIIGSTTFTVRIGSDFIDKEINTLMPVEENQILEVEEVVEVSADFEGELGDVQGDGFNESGQVEEKSIFKNPEKRKKLLYVVVGIVLVWVFLGDDTSTKKKVKKDPKKKEKVVTKSGKAARVYTAEEKEFLDATYQLGKELYSQGKYDQAIFELDKVFSITPKYKNAKQIFELSKVGLAKLEELERKKQLEIDRKERMRKVKELVTKASEATKDKNVNLAQGLFQQIMQLDPENFEVPTMRMEIDAWKKELDRKSVEKAQKESERKRQVDTLSPGKNYYIKEEWHKAVLKLESFMRKKNIDVDLMQDAGRMLKEAKSKLNSVVGPLLGKARSLKEGQDLKGAYEHYKEILDFDPTSEEALNEMDSIRDQLTNRARKIYNEALVREELSKFELAKEKFEEVQQVAPSDSEYYEKATNKLKEYLD